MGRRAVTLACALALSAGCDDAPSAPSVHVELGSGVSTFVPVPAGATLRITEGIQGGFHIFASVRAEGLERLDAALVFALYQGEAQIGGARYLDDLQVDGEGLVYAGATVFLFADQPPEGVAGLDTRLTVEITDRAGRTGSAALGFTPACCDYLR